ncbi:ABC transporter substrate-binding protein [Litorilinea aerophila]|nr:ABC transporter substrate-binding protein [Litorilinea aerophila]MCC9078442.1 ABC transporter substrate-binding protein [Litorilinea aerophila]
MRFLFILLTLQPGLAACQGIRAPAPPLTAVAVQLSWTHSSQFAGLYVADQQGYYAEEGLDVTWLEGGPTVDRLAALLAGEAQFAIASGPEIIRARAAGAPIRAIATIFRRSPFAFFSLADSGITRPEDFGGKVIQIRPRARPILYIRLLTMSKCLNEC